MTSDRDLIERYRRGEEKAFEEFYRRHRRPIFAYLLACARNRETAEELLQETFFAFLRSLDRLDGSADLRPYLFRTARNLAIDWVRRRRSSERALERRAADPFFRRCGEAPSEAADEDAERLSALLDRLPDEQREAIVLKVFGGLTFREIGLLTGSPEATVVSRYRYGLEKLRASFSPGGCT
ncbi:MAG: RNA polymerase sigma factor [Planctomycetota bacterium]